LQQIIIDVGERIVLALDGRGCGVDHKFGEPDEMKETKGGRNSG
jgi:hypothetical protein